MSTSKFESLLDELEGIGTLAKSLGADENDDGGEESSDERLGADEDDDAIAAAAADGESDDDDELLGKSMVVTMPDGEEVEAYDGIAVVTAMAKSLRAMKGRLAQTETALTKALHKTVEINKELAGKAKAQSALIKSLESRIEKMGGQGAGRKSTVSVHERPDTTSLSKSVGSEGIEPALFKSMALQAQKGGKISGIDVSMIESYINSGQADKIPPHLITAVAGGAAN